MDSFANARLGIQLAQQGRKTEALNYLRIAVQTEPPHAEVWLWLAHVTPLREEYDHSLRQALAIVPTHTTARQMLSALQQSTFTPAIEAVPPQGSTRVVVDDNLVRKMRRKRRSRSQKRFLWSILLLCALLGISAGIGLGFRDVVMDNSTDTEPVDQTRVANITITPINRNIVASFSVELPTTWLLADRNNPAWQESVGALTDNPSVQTAIQNFEFDQTVLEINPADDTVQPVVSFVDTDVSTLTDNSTISRLQLIRLGAPYASLTDTTCAGIAQLASDSDAIVNLDSSPATWLLLDSGVIEQVNSSCIFYLKYQQSNVSSGAQLHTYVVYVPAGNDLLAEWHITIEAISRTDSVVEMILQSIRFS